MKEERYYFEKWKDVVATFNIWLDNVYDETKGEDWWKALKNWSLGENDFNFNDIRNFTSKEKVNLKTELEDVTLQAFEIGNMTADELKII